MLCNLSIVQFRVYILAKFLAKEISSGYLAIEHFLSIYAPTYKSRQHQPGPCWMSLSHQPLQAPCPHPWRYHTSPSFFTTYCPPQAPSMDRDTLISRLKGLDGRRAWLEVERIGVLEEIACLKSEELRTRKQLQEAQHRCQLLESGLMQLRTTPFPMAELVGDLELICTSPLSYSSPTADKSQFTTCPKET